VKVRLDIPDKIYRLSPSGRGRMA